MLARLSTSCTTPPLPSASLLLILVQHYRFDGFIFRGTPESQSHSQLGGHMSKKRPPNHSEFFYYRSLGATVVPTENGPAFFRLFFKVLKAFQL